MATDIGTKIKRARERRRWSQQELANRLGVNRKTVDNWENGRTQPANSIGALEEVLDIDLSGDEEADRSPPARLSDEAREAIRRDIEDPVLAEQVIAYAEGLASGRIPYASAFLDDGPPESGSPRRRARG